MTALAIRPWRLSCAVTALRAAFPGAKVHIRHYVPRAGFADFSVSQPITITEESRELLSMTTSWAPRRLRVAAEVLNACPQEADIAALIAGVAPKMERGAVVKLGEEPVVAEQAPTKARPRVGLGRRVPPEELALVGTGPARVALQVNPRWRREP